MTQVNFVDEFRSIMRYASQNSLSLRERSFWIALFYIANDRAVYNENARTYDWPDGFFPVSNNELNLHSCLDKRGIDTVRNQLKQRGILDFTKGFKNVRNPAYKLNYLSPRAGYKIVPNDAPNNDPKNEPNNAPNDVPNDGPSEAPLPKTDYPSGSLETGRNTTTQTLRAVNGPGGSGGVSIGYSDLVMYARNYLQSMTRDNEAKLVQFAHDGMETSVIRKVINDACARGCAKFGYVNVVLTRYKNSGILTLTAAHEDDKKHREATAPVEAPKKKGHGYLEHEYKPEDFGDDFFYDLSKDYPEEGANEA